MADLYSLDTRGKKRRKWRKRLSWLIILLVIAGLISYAVVLILRELKPETTIKQATPIKTHVSYETKTTRYKEANFTIDILKDWKQIPRPAGHYQTYTWQTSDSGTDGQVLTIYEDTIPANFAVNRVLIVRGEGEHLVQTGTASDNCSKYTRDSKASAGQVGAAAKWQDVDFLCDQSNKQRDVIGTSSLDGVNTVIMKGPTAGQHKYFFSYASYNAANPDYTPFYNALNTFKMQ
jgi:hypothetical protein